MGFFTLPTHICSSGKSFANNFTTASDEEVDPDVPNDTVYSGGDDGGDHDEDKGEFP